MPEIIVTHASPDLDALTSVYLLQRYAGLADAAVCFVNTGSPDPAVLAAAAAVVDTGRELDPARLRFDHHQDALLPSAAMLVFDWLCERGADVAHLEPLIALVNANDLGQPHDGKETSALLGLHALISVAKHHQHGDDQAVLAWGLSLLAMLDGHLRRHAEARTQVLACLRWQSPDGRVVALDTTGVAGGAVTRAAGEVLGCELAVWVSSEAGADGRTTHSVGCMRLGESTVDVGELADQAMHRANHIVAFELRQWFKHASGFFAGRGTPKAPRYDVPDVDAEAVARALWVALVRKPAHI
jgi:hypothetical protein